MKKKFNIYLLPYFFIYGFLLSCAACSNSYYVNIDNQKKYADPLTNNDIIRVVLPNKLNNIIEEARNNNKNKPELIDKISDEIDAKKATENQLQQMSMHIINAGGVSQDGSTQKDGKPTVIALVDGYILPGSIQNKTYMWEVPAVTDMMGNAIATQTDAKIVTYMTYMYMIKLIRIKDRNDPLLYCNNSTKTLGLCLAPTIITNNSIIFESNGSFRTFKNDKVNPFAVINKAIFYNYPQMTGKKHVFFPSTQDHVPDIEKVINIPISQ